VWLLHTQDIDRKNLQTAAILKRQADQIIELQSLYKEEQILRKRYFNMMEGMSYVLCFNVFWSFPESGVSVLFPSAPFQIRFSFPSSECPSYRNCPFAEDTYNILSERCVSLLLFAEQFMLSL